MCTLVLCEKRKLTKQEFKNCDSMNGDGIGFAFNKGGEQYFKKGFMDFNSGWNFYKKIPFRSHIVHFRLGTSGARSAALTHPFICSEKSPLATEGVTNYPIIFHNGVIYDWRKNAKLEQISTSIFMSDTRALSIQVARYGIENFKDLIKETDGKFITLYKGRAKVYGKFILDNGVWFSNDHYKIDLNRYNFYFEDDFYGGLNAKHAINSR